VTGSFLIAWHFLTAIPLMRVNHEPKPSELARSMGWFPAVGLILGALLVVSDRVLSGMLAPGVVEGLLVALLVMATGGLHQDGFADMLDGLAGGRTPAERLTIMRDARIGAIGATGLILALGLRYAALVALPQGDRAPILLCMPAVGRWTMVLGALSAPYARPEGGLGQPFLRHVLARDVRFATLSLAVALVVALGLMAAVLALVMAAVVAVGIGRLCHRLCEGVTGDTLGATNELAEINFLLIGPTLLHV
jgi:adenosylcobinamide-GDP ribazoletransferase